MPARQALSDATPARDTAVASSRALLRAAVAADGPAATSAASSLLADGATTLQVYRTVARALLPRAILPARATWAHGLFALDAALFLAEVLPPPERAPVFAYAVGLAVADWPALDPVPHALPGMFHAGTDTAWSAPLLAQQVRAAALAADGAGAEWALSTLLAGPDRGFAPTASVTKAAYSAVLSAATQAETRTGGWGHLLVAGQHAVEIAALLPPSHTLLALRPALWDVARAAGCRRTIVAPSGLDVGAPHIRCALSINRRPARPGETLQWAIAFRTRPTPQVMDEALASGLVRGALLDAAVLAVAGATAAAVAGRGPALHGPADSRRFAALGGHVLLALHAARRADDLTATPEDAILAALSLLSRLSRLTAPWPSPRGGTETPETPAGLARAAATHLTPHALALGEAMLAEYADAQSRSAEYAAALMRAASLMLRRTRAA
jgi:hypothetical protein